MTVVETSKFPGPDYLVFGNTDSKLHRSAFVHLCFALNVYIRMHFEIYFTQVYITEKIV